MAAPQLNLHVRGSWLIRDPAFYRHVATIATPIILQQLITVGVNMMDTIMLSNFGEAQIAGSSLANEFINIFLICSMGLGMGASVLTARYWGAQKPEPLKNVITIMLRLMLAIACLFTLAVIYIPELVMAVYAEDPLTIDHGARYLLWSCPTFLLMGGSVTLTQVLRSIGKAKIPLYSAILAFFVNIFFNYVFIFGKFGAPRLEIAGAALGTVIARVAEFVFIVGYVMVVEKDLGYRPKNLLQPCGELLGLYVKISIPVLVSDLLLALGNTMTSIIVGHISTPFVAANAVVAMVMRLATVFTSGVSNASCVITGQTLGQGKFEVVKKQGYTFLFLGGVLGLSAGLFITLVSGPVVGFYAFEPETTQIAMEMMAAVSFIVFFQCANSILTKGVLRAGGDTRFLMLADILFLWVASVPLGALAGLVWHLPPFWTYVCLRIDQVIKAIWCVGRLGSGKWIRPMGFEHEKSFPN